MDAVAEAEKLLKGLTDDVQAAEDAILLASQMQTSLKQLGEVRGASTLHQHHLFLVN